MKLNKPKNINYCATIGKIDKIIELSNCDNVVAAIVCGNQVIVSKTSKIGDMGIFFPVETKLSEKYCYYNNLNSDSSLNENITKKGYTSKGRIKCVAFRGNKSEGLFMPLNSLQQFLNEDEILSLNIGDEFDELKGQIICEKYIIPENKDVSNIPIGAKARGIKRKSRVIDSQFKFHDDTPQFKKNAHKISPNDIISITDKWHGTSAVAGNVLINRKLNILDKILLKIGVNIPTTEYGLIYSSRRIIKNKYYISPLTYTSIGITFVKDLYRTIKNMVIYRDMKNCSYPFLTAFGDYKKLKSKSFNEKIEPNDVWYTTSQELKSIIPNGFTLYYEIVGYSGFTKEIQKGYNYGCEHGKKRIKVYRITQVKEDGKTYELSFGQIKDFCNKFGIEHVEEFYYGKAKDLFPDLKIDENWNNLFLERLIQSFNMEKMCKFNNEKVPAEGLVLRVDNLFEFKAFKLKSYKFLCLETKNLDNGEDDIEIQQNYE